MRLERTELGEQGIFSEFLDNYYEKFSTTVEHAFTDGKYNWIPKIPDGIYKCVRGNHRLKNMTEDFETFEITGIPDFQGAPVSGCVFHWGNYNESSEGCVCLGKEKSFDDTKKEEMVTDSRETFKLFMNKMFGLDSFMLEIVTL